jgi:hypothetical protein
MCSVYKFAKRQAIWTNVFLVLSSFLKINAEISGLVARVPGCSPRGPGFDSWRYQFFRVVVGLEQGPLNLMRPNEELTK